MQDNLVENQQDTFLGFENWKFPIFYSRNHVVLLGIRSSLRKLI